MHAIEFSDPDGIVAGKGSLSQVGETAMSAGRRLVFISGQVAWDKSGGLVGEHSFREQFVQVYENLATAISSRGGTMSDIVSLRTYLTDPNDLPEFHRLREDLYPTIFPRLQYPTNTLLIISRLAEAELRLEVEAVGVI